MQLTASTICIASTTHIACTIHIASTNCICPPRVRSVLRVRPILRVRSILRVRIVSDFCEYDLYPTSSRVRHIIVFDFCEYDLYFTASSRVRHVFAAMFLLISPGEFLRIPQPVLISKWVLFANSPATPRSTYFTVYFSSSKINLLHSFIASTIWRLPYICRSMAFAMLCRCAFRAR